MDLHSRYIDDLIKYLYIGKMTSQGPACIMCAAEWWFVQTVAVVIGHTDTDKKWEVPGKFANRKGRPEPKKKKNTAAADETSERRESTVSQTT